MIDNIQNFRNSYSLMQHIERAQARSMVSQVLRSDEFDRFIDHEFPRLDHCFRLTNQNNKLKIRFCSLDGSCLLVIETYQEDIAPIILLLNVEANRFFLILDEGYLAVRTSIEMFDSLYQLIFNNN